VYFVAVVTEMKRITTDCGEKKKVLIGAEEWKAMLKRLLVLTLFLASRGLRFQGDSTKIGAVNNGNFVGIIELLGHDDEISRKFIQSPKKSEDETMKRKAHCLFCMG
jgi:hypothetical protein